MNETPAFSSALATETPREGWTRNRFLFLVTLLLAAHVALIFIFGTKKQIAPRAVVNVPRWQLADRDSEFIALGDPTLFARPNAHDVVTEFWRRTPSAAPPDFNWTEPPRYLAPAAENFGAAFRAFMRANQPAEFQLRLQPEPKITAPVALPADELPAATTMQVTGDLANRQRLNQIALPAIPSAEIIAPSRVQALVDADGNVASAVLLESSALPAADQRALQLVRELRFAPAPQLMFGEIIFNWRTVPPANTNEIR